ncbi:MAG: phosphatase [Candidatus Poribacteria bacterium]|nr:MAG: phosphatase [Candidatus Poribacteria bacterium]
MSGNVRYPWYIAWRYRLIRSAKDLWSLIDRRLRVSRVEKGLYLGGKLTPARTRYLEERGVQAVISLQSEALDPMGPFRAHLWLPSFDGRPPVAEQLLLGAEFIRQQLDAGHGVYVHCHAGVGRAPTLVAVYYLLRGLSPQESVQRVREARPFVRMNRYQLEAIESCFALLQRRRTKKEAI